METNAIKMTCIRILSASLLTNGPAVPLLSICCEQVLALPSSLREHLSQNRMGAGPNFAFSNQNSSVSRLAEIPLVDVTVS